VQCKWQHFVFLQWFSFHVRSKRLTIPRTLAPPCTCRNTAWLQWRNLVNGRLLHARFRISVLRTDFLSA
jgi:hypothetical protein